MFAKDRTLFRCPYCPRGKGRLVLNAHKCATIRDESPQAYTLEGERFVDGQRLVLFDPPSERLNPCRHLLFAEGLVIWHSGRLVADDENEGEPVEETWNLHFGWEDRRLHLRDLCHSQNVWFDYLLTLGGVPVPYFPSVPFQLVPVRRSWSEVPPEVSPIVGYEIDELFLVTPKPNKFIAELTTKADAYMAFLSKLKFPPPVWRR